MAVIDFGGVKEEVVTRAEYPLAAAVKTLSSETVAVLGYGPQGQGQSLNLKDNGVKVIVGQRKGGRGWKDAVDDGWVEGVSLFSDLGEAVRRGTVVEYLLSDAGQKEHWSEIKANLRKGQALCFSHGFSVVFKEQTHIVPPLDVDVILVAPKGADRPLEFPGRERDQFKLRGLPGCDGKGARAGHSLGDRCRLRVPLPDDIREGSVQ